MILIKQVEMSRNEFYKFNNTGARVLDYIYHRTFNLPKNLISVMKM